MEKQDTFNFQNPLSKFVICTHDQTVKNTFFYVQDTGCLKKEDSAAFSQHEVDSFLIAAVIKGRGELFADGRKSSLTEGDCFFIDCNISHSLKSSDDEPMEIMWVHFNGSTSQQYFDYFIKQSEIIFRPQFFDKAVTAISKLIEICGQNENNSEIISSKLIVELLTIALTVGSSDGQFDSGLKQKLASVHAYIDDHFSEDLSLEKLSSQFYISKYYLTREYKKIYYISFENST
mgnify:CR=1 FL=1